MTPEQRARTTMQVITDCLDEANGDADLAMSAAEYILSTPTDEVERRCREEQDRYEQRRCAKWARKRNRQQLRPLLDTLNDALEPKRGVMLALSMALEEQNQIMLSLEDEWRRRSQLPLCGTEAGGFPTMPAVTEVGRLARLLVSEGGKAEEEIDASLLYGVPEGAGSTTSGALDTATKKGKQTRVKGKGRKKRRALPRRLRVPSYKDYTSRPFFRAPSI
jgi:hypothetical protein